MDNTQSYFVYSPPKSNSHGHAVRDKNIRRATQKVIDSFVSNFKMTTDNKLWVSLSYDKEIELENAQRTIKKLTEFLGPSKQEFTTKQENTVNLITWENQNKNILDLLEYVDKLKGSSYLPLSKYWIYCIYSTKQSGYIICSVEFGRLFVRLRFIIPYPIDNDKCYELLSKLYNSLPFKLNGKHFRRLGPGKKGYGQWKLDEEMQKRLNSCLIESK